MPCSRGCCETQREHYASVSVSCTAIPSRRPSALATVQTDKRWDRDMAAYRRLRQDGLQPRQIDGSALVEKMATSESQVENAVVPSA